MKKSINLNKRWKGPWANFESFLLKNEHTGFIEWRGRNAFRLKKTPFSNHYSKFLYVVPDEIILPEQGLIRVKTGELYREIQLEKNSTLGNYTNQSYIVEGYELIDTNSLPKPSISKEEFLYYMVENWQGPDNYPLFKKEVAYNILSCQKDFFGIGGVGVETFAPAGSSQTMKLLKSSIGNLLPDEFKKKNELFEYNFITKEGEVEITNNRRNDPRSSEVSFNDMSRLSSKMNIANLGIQIPLILPDDVIYRSLDYYNPDVMDYQLRALLVKPTIEPALIEKFTDLAIQTSEYVDKNYTEETLLLDKLAHIKIACASCRLDLKNELTEDMLPKIKDEISEMFKEYADTYRDRMITGGVARWNIPMKPLSERHNLTIDANQVLRELLEVDKDNQDIGISWMTSKEIKKRPKLKFISDLTFQKALMELNNANLILQRKNYSELFVVHYEK
jgi:hypothetical protein